MGRAGNLGRGGMGRADAWLQHRMAHCGLARGASQSDPGLSGSFAGICSVCRLMVLRRMWRMATPHTSRCARWGCGCLRLLFRCGLWHDVHSLLVICVWRHLSPVWRWWDLHSSLLHLIQAAVRGDAVAACGCSFGAGFGTRCTASLDICVWRHLSPAWRWRG